MHIQTKMSVFTTAEIKINDNAWMLRERRNVRVAERCGTLDPTATPPIVNPTRRRGTRLATDGRRDIRSREPLSRYTLPRFK